MCNCVDVEMGSYSNTVILGYYPVMYDYRERRKKQGLPINGICVDRCIADEIIELWEAGIMTYGSCCGHNIVEGMINVGEECFDKAIALGWEKYEFLNNPERCDTVKIRKISGTTFKPHNELKSPADFLQAFTR